MLLILVRINILKNETILSKLEYKLLITFDQ